MNFSNKKSPILELFNTRKGEKFEIDRSQCPVAKILVYIVVNEFLPTGFH
jgi:hypothetical protein